MANDIRIFQIYYNQATEAALDPAFEPLDNSKNERPDWFEYWPIRNWLQANTLDDETYYGFFSPKFGVKTRLSGAKVRAFVAAQRGADVITFSPTPDWACVYLSVFEQGESYHPGLAGIAQDFFNGIGLAVDIKSLVTDLRTSVFANYFVAKGSFWRRWQAIFDQCFAQAENPASPLHGRLTSLTEYYNPAQQKIFLMERVVSTLLSTTPGLRVSNYPPFDLPVSDDVWRKLFDNLVTLDALKIAFLQTGDELYLKTYVTLRKMVNDAFWQRRRPN